MDGLKFFQISSERQSDVIKRKKMGTVIIRYRIIFLRKVLNYKI